MVGAGAGVQDALPSDVVGRAAAGNLQEHEDWELVSVFRGGNRAVMNGTNGLFFSSNRPLRHIRMGYKSPGQRYSDGR